MKTLIKIKLFCMIITIILISCDKDTYKSPDEIPEAKIRRKLFFNSTEEIIPKEVHEYHYDDEMNLIRINHCSTMNCYHSCIYELFSYSDDFKLQKEITYHLVSDSIGWKVSDSTFYKYEYDKLIYEETFYFDHTSISFKYEYSNLLLINKIEYHNQNLSFYTHFEYNDKNLCTKESIYSDSSKTELKSYKIHDYNKNNQLIKSDFYLQNNQIFQTINYNYNEKGQLILEESKRINPDIVKPIEYVIRYEYY